MTIHAPQLGLRAGETHRGVLPRGDLRTLDLPWTTPLERRQRQYWSGLMWQLGTASYWETLARESTAPTSHRIGESLEEEAAACILGGFGVPFGIGNAAFAHLRDLGLFRSNSLWDAQEIEQALEAPLRIGTTSRRYRFPRQRAHRIAAALDTLRKHDEPVDDIALRDLLLSVTGIGPKTASWIVRNHRNSDRVAIIDIHIARAGIVAGVFSPRWRLPRDYDLCEGAFISWASHAGLRPSLLDAVIWGALAHNPRQARDVLGLGHDAGDLQPVWPIAQTDSATGIAPRADTLTLSVRKRSKA